MAKVVRSEPREEDRMILQGHLNMDIRSGMFATGLQRLQAKICWWTFASRVGRLRRVSMLLGWKGPQRVERELRVTGLPETADPGALLTEWTNCCRSNR